MYRYCYHRQKIKSPPATTKTSVCCSCLSSLGITHVIGCCRAKGTGSRNKSASRRLQGGASYDSTKDTCSTQGKKRLVTGVDIKIFGNDGKFIRERRNQNSQSAKISRRKATGFLSYGLTALGFLVVTCLHGRIDLGTELLEGEVGGCCKRHHTRFRDFDT